MIRRFKYLIGLDNETASTKRLLHVESQRVSSSMLETVQEVAIYIHRFHNLDLFQQGWYQIKITLRWEDGSNTSLGTPSRVVQYEVPDLGSDDYIGVWRIDDADNSFSTPPFWIKYARQNVLLSVMVSFNMSLKKYEDLSASAVILRFELLYNPIPENGSELQASLDEFPAAVHEFRIPPKALLGLHSYCPVYFDAFHAVLVDLSIHIILLKASAYVPPQKVHSGSSEVEDVAGENCEGSAKVSSQGATMDLKHIVFIKALLTARDILLEELQKLSKAIDQTIDLTDAITNVNKMKVISSHLQVDLSTSNVVVAEERIKIGQVAGEPQSELEKANGVNDSGSDGVLLSLTREDLLNTFHLLGDQLSSLWNVFLKFHRANKTKILDFLHDTWANDRKAEWSIWMIYSKLEMPQHNLRSGIDESSNHSIRGKVSLSRKLTDDSVLTSITRAELHRRSIGQMRINSRSIQDMYIFGDPLRAPVIIVERVVNIPLRTTSGNAYFITPTDLKDTLMGPGFKAASPQRNGHVLKIVVFVHGFQGHHLDLRLVRNQWLLIDPGAECLMSEVNEEKTSGDFRDMGLRLAEEVSSFLKKKIDKASRSGGFRNIKLSFVGHSIGNVIIRSALAESIMEPFLKYLYTYMSISGPHLGYLYSSNSLFKSGLWLLKKLKGSQCIHQLTFTDDPDLRNTFFYKLSKQKTIENFKNIILLASPQDGYVPYHSARIELCQASRLDYSKKGQVFLEMLNNCLDQIQSPSSERRMFMRCDVNFDTSFQGRSLNTIIGRAAHIEFLETDIYAKFIMWSFPELFS